MRNIKNNYRLTASLAAVVLAVVLLIATSLALFTDREQAKTTAKAGIVDITLDDAGGKSTVNLTNKENINPGDYDPVNWGQTGYNGGTPHDLTFTVTNKGNKSVRIRNSIIVSCKDKTGNILDARYLALADKINPYTELAEKRYVLQDKTTVTVLPPITTKVIAIEYIIPMEKVLSGTGSVSPEAETINGLTCPVSQAYTYYFTMDRSTPNAYQASDIQIDVLTEALQYRNTNTADWALMSVKTWTSDGTGATKAVLPNRSEDTLSGPAG